ncbi:DUF3515 family protein [Streptomyces sp. NBC_00005]|uniref:DUF3515 family protein n=1 Tax=Streptomyces sp. NBC_00005 TaxID=2903609 RepID=UPI003243799B
MQGVLRARRVRVAVALGGAGLVVGGVLVVREVNAPVGGVEAAADGGTPQCARITRAYPDGLGGQRRDDAALPGVGVWGGGTVTARCGVEPPAATTDPCVSVDGVDWVWRPAKPGDGRKVLVTYGRDPAVEVVISDRVAGTDDVLVEMSRAVSPVAQHAKCIGDDDVAAPAAG